MSGGTRAVGCEQAFEDDRVARYLSGEAPEAERDAFEIHVLECEACRAALLAQMDLADALRSTHPPVAARAPAVLPPPRWLPLAAAVAVAALAGTLYLREGPTPMTPPPVSPVSPTPPPRGEGTAEKAPESLPPAAPPLASFVLSPGFRGEGDQRLSIPPGTGPVRLQLNPNPGDEYREYRAELRTADGDTLWSQSRLETGSSGGERFVLADLPERLLGEGDYELTLKGVDGAGRAEDIGYYHFSVRRRSR